MTLNRLFQRLRSESGVTSIEFAFIAPILAFIVMALSDVGLYVHDRSKMTSSIKSGVDYFLLGGQDTDTAVEIVKKAWSDRPENTFITTAKYCLCGNVEVSCNSICLDSTQPEAYKKIAVTAYYDGLLLRTKYYSDETIRIR